MFKKIKALISNRCFLIFLIMLIGAAASWQFISSNSLFSLVSSDQGQYDDIAINLLEGRGFFWSSDLWAWATERPPAYPLFLALIYSFFGHDFITVKIIQFILSIFIGVFVYLIAERVFNKAVAFFAAAFISIYPTYLSFNLSLIRETLFILSLVIFSYLVILSLEKPAWKIFILAGLVYGLMALNRPVIIAAMPLYLLWLAFIFRKNKKIILRAIIGIGLVASIILGSWLARNYIRSGAPVLEYVGLTNVWSYNTGHAKQYGAETANINPEILWSNPYATEGARANKLSREAAAGIFKNPAQFLRRGARNIITMHCLKGTCYRGWEPVLLIFGFIGLFIGLIFMPVITAGFLATIAAIILPSAIFGGDDSRFRTPIDWIYVMYIFFAVFVLFKSLSKREEFFNSVKKYVSSAAVLNICKIFKYSAAVIVLIVAAFTVFGLGKIGYANVFCRNIFLSNFSSQKAEEILEFGPFRINSKTNNWAPFDDIKKYLFEHQMNLGNFNYKLINWTGIVRNPKYFNAGEPTDSYLLADLRDEAYKFRLTVFNFVINADSCSPPMGNFYAIMPGFMPKEFLDQKAVIVGQLKQNDTVVNRLGIHVLAVVPLDGGGNPDFGKTVFAEDIKNLQKGDMDFYR